MASNEEFDKFKEEILNRILEVEKNLIFTQPKIMEMRLNDCVVKLDRSVERINEIEKMTNKDKVLLDSIHDLKTREWDSHQKISSQESKLINLSREVKDTVTKYDKLYLDNLYLPGLIGDSNCRFKNMKEFIEVRNIYVVVFDGKYVKSDQF